MTSLLQAKRDGYWQHWTEDQKKSVREMLMDRDLSYSEIARAFGVEGGAGAVHTYALHVGAPVDDRKGGKSRRLTVDVAVVKNLHAVETQIEVMLRKQAEVAAELHRLQEVRDELAIHFERDGDDVMVIGVGAAPFRASADQWMLFLNKEGARKLREFIVSMRAHELR